MSKVRQSLLLPLGQFWLLIHVLSRHPPYRVKPPWLLGINKEIPPLPSMNERRGTSDKMKTFSQKKVPPTLVLRMHL